MCVYFGRVDVDKQAKAKHLCMPENKLQSKHTETRGAHDSEEEVDRVK